MPGEKNQSLQPIGLREGLGSRGQQLTAIREKKVDGAAMSVGDRYLDSPSLPPLLMHTGFPMEPTHYQGNTRSSPVKDWKPHVCKRRSRLSAHHGCSTPPFQPSLPPKAKHGAEVKWFSCHESTPEACSVCGILSSWFGIRGPHGDFITLDHCKCALLQAANMPKKPADCLKKRRIKSLLCLFSATKRKHTCHNGIDAMPNYRQFPSRYFEC